MLFSIINIDTADIITGIIAGIVSSIMLSVLIGVSRPKIRVSKKIAEAKGKYRFKIQNNSNRDIGDTYIRVTYRTTNNGTHTYTTYCPILHSKRNSKRTYYNEAKIIFKNAIWRRPTNDVNSKKQDTEELSINKFFEANRKDEMCCVELEIIYYDYNLIYGAVRRFIKQKYTYENIAFDSVFIKGSLTPVLIQDIIN